MPSVPKRLVGLILNIGHSHASRVMVGVQRYAIENNWQVLVQHIHHHDPLDVWLRRGVDGFIMQATTPELVAFEQGAPVINISSLSRTQLITVTADHNAIGRVAAEHLLTLPLSHFAYAGLEHEFCREAAQGFSSVIEKAGYHCQVFFSPRYQGTELISRLPRPCGLMVASDVYGAYLVRDCNISNVPIQQQIAIVSMGNTPDLCDLAIPSLTSVDQGSERIGYEAAEMLNRRLRGELVESRRLPPGPVVQRDSTRMVGYDPDIDQALRIIRESSHRPLRVSELAQQLRIEKRTLERRFARVLGRSPQAEIMRARIEHARQLLAVTALSIPNVARRCGFESATRFGTIFRKLTGTTPSAYRRQNQLPAAGQNDFSQLP